MLHGLLRSNVYAAVHASNAIRAVVTAKFEFTILSKDMQQTPSVQHDLLQAALQTVVQYSESFRVLDSMKHRASPLQGLHGPLPSPLVPPTSPLRSSLLLSRKRLP